MGRQSKQKREKSIKKAMGKYKSPSPKNTNSSKSRHPTYSSLAMGAGVSIEITGVYSYSGKGFGFVDPDPEFEQYGTVFIPPRDGMGAMSGDRVKAVITSLGSFSGDKGPSGEVTSVEYSCDSIIGTLYVQDGYAYLVPDSKKYGVNIWVPYKDVETSGAEDGSKVEVIPSGEPKFTRTRSLEIVGPRDMPYFDTEGRIATVFGSSDTKEANYYAILYASGIPTEFDEDVLRSAAEAAAEEITPSGNGRHDLRGMTIMTIDGASAKDLDDAVSLEENEDGWILRVCIADVSHYVRQNTPVELEARERGTSVYFIDKVVPMLPEILSNGVCSLNAGEDKYALTAEIHFDRDGWRTETFIYKSIIRSSCRGVYEEVNDIFANGEESEFADKYRAVLPMLESMRKFYRILAENYGTMIELEENEAVILVDSDGNPVDIVKRERGDGEKLIEQFMLQANSGVAEVLYDNALPCMYRVHGVPEDDKLKSLAIFCNNIGIPAQNLLEPGIEPEELAARMGRILDKAHDLGVSSMVSSVMLRSMPKARYTDESAPHFGLGIEDYCHFTSPIRRYPDLFVHSVITAVLEKTHLDTLSSDTDADFSCASSFAACAAERADAATEREIRAQEAERDIEDLYMCLYMRDRIDDEFDVTVSSVIRGGMFVQCDNLIEGFIPQVYLPGCRINAELMTLYWAGETYTLGSKIHVFLDDVDLATRKITFSPAE